MPTKIITPFVLKEFFDGIFLSKIQFPFPLNPYLKKNVISLPIFFFGKNFQGEVNIIFDRTIPSKKHHIDIHK